MKIEINTKILKEGLKKVNKFKVANNKEIPILDNILFVAERDYITLIRSDIDAMIKVKVSCNVIEEGEMLISKNNIKLINKLKENYLAISDELLTTKKKEIEITNYNVDDYPPIINCNDKKWETSKNDIERLMEVTTATAKDDLRPILQGVYIDKSNWVALDGYRLSKRKGNYQSDYSVIVTGKQVELLKKLITKNTGTIEFLIDKNERYNSFKFDNVEIIGAKLDGEYIRYNQIIPEITENYIKINKEEILEELEFIKETEKDCKNGISTTHLKNDFDNNILNLISKNQTCNIKSKVSVIKSNKGHLENNFMIAFNTNYIYEGLKSYKNYDGLYIIYQRKNIDPIIITDSINSNDIDLILPVRMSNK